MLNINWDVFSEEEKQELTQCYEAGNYKNLCCLPGVNIDTPEKEREIEKMVLDLREIDVDDESAVKKELEEFWADSGKEMTPEKEVEFQEKIDKEKEEAEAKREEEKKKAGIEKEEVVEESLVGEGTPIAEGEAPKASESTEENKDNK